MLVKCEGTITTQSSSPETGNVSKWSRLDGRKVFEDEIGTLSYTLHGKARKTSATETPILCPSKLYSSNNPSKEDD